MMGLLVAVAVSGAMSTFIRPDAVRLLVDVLEDDRFSPGVSCCVILNRLSCIVPPRREHWERLEFNWDSSVDCIPDGVVHGKLLLDGVLISHPSDILFRLDNSDMLVDCGGSERYHPIVPHNRLKNMWRLSVFDSDLSDFPDIGNPDFCLGMPMVKASNLAHCFPPWTMSREQWTLIMRSSVSGIAVDALLFSQMGVPLFHQYSLEPMWPSLVRT